MSEVIRFTAPNKRWRATVFYRSDNGAVDVQHDLEELSEIDEIVERGPHWDTIERVVIERVNHIESEALTVEQAEQL